MELSVIDGWFFKKKTSVLLQKGIESYESIGHNNDNQYTSSMRNILFQCLLTTRDKYPYIE
jgi:hypothetical protein